MQTICSHVKWKNYHCAIKSELRNHIYGSISDLTEQGLSEEEALNLTLQNIGTPDILGRQLNQAYQPEWHKTLLFTVLFSMILFSVFEYSAFIETTGKYLYLAKIISNIINGMLLLFPLLGCCFIERVKNKKGIGLFFTMLIFAIPILLAYYVQAYAGMSLLAVNAWILLLLTIKSNWFAVGRKNFMYALVSLPYLYIFLYSAIRKIDNIRLNMTGFFAKDIIKNSVLFGRANSDLIHASGIIDHPLTLMTASYGYIILIAYLFFFSFLMFEIVKIYRRQRSFLSRLLILSIIISFLMEFAFSLLLNLGVPLVKGISVPFLDFHFGIVVKLIQLGGIELLDCFGNYLFSNYPKNKLFDIEDGKIIIYYK